MHAPTPQVSDRLAWLAAEVRAFREDFQTVRYCFENRLAPNGAADPRD